MIKIVSNYDLNYNYVLGNNTPNVNFSWLYSNQKLCIIMEYHLLPINNGFMSMSQAYLIMLFSIHMR